MANLKVGSDDYYSSWVEDNFLYDYWIEILFPTKECNLE